MTLPKRATPKEQDIWLPGDKSCHYFIMLKTIETYCFIFKMKLLPIRGGGGPEGWRKGGMGVEGRSGEG